MMTLVLILLIWSTAVLVCVLTLSSMRKLKAQQRAGYYARKRELAGIPPYDGAGRRKKWLIPEPAAVGYHCHGTFRKSSAKAPRAPVLFPFGTPGSAWRPKI